MGLLDSQIRQHAQELQLRESANGATVLFHGNSMNPFLQDGDELRVEPVTYDEIAVGDIITFRLRDHFPTLRVLYKGRNKLVLGADNWRERKFATWREFVLGRVVARTRDGKTLAASAPAWKWHTAVLFAKRRAARRIQNMRQRTRQLKLKLLPPPPKPDLPHNLQLRLSSICNLKCRMCPYLPIHASDEHQKLMLRETFERMLPTIRRAKIVHFSGGGETFFHPELFEFIARVRQEVPDCFIDLTTNGTLLTRERAARILDLRVSKLHVSFDGLPENVGAIRTNLNGHKVWGNIRMLAEMKRARGLQTPSIQINYVMAFGSYRDLPDFIPLAREVGANEIQLIEMRPANRHEWEGNMWNEMQRDGGHALKVAHMLANQYNLRLHLPKVGPNLCWFPRNPHITEAGNVYPCSYLDYDGHVLYHDGAEHFFPPMLMGNVNTTAFTDIWHSEKYRAFREQTARGDFDANCRTCYHSRLPAPTFLREQLELPN
jgi:MoaA/NifB/PqqE/SkfB family radical SAM enzyme